MRFGAVFLAALVSCGPARAEGAREPPGCLSPQDMREIVSTNKVVPPAAAIRTARQVFPKADVVRAHLCIRGEDLVYVIVGLDRDGRFVRARIEARSGRVVATTD